jgi:hypothetical protein
MILFSYIVAFHPLKVCVYGSIQFHFEALFAK